MPVSARPVGVTADLTLLVQRDAAGGLEAGALALLEAVDGVSAVRAVDVTGVTPRLNDLAVEATADLRLDLPTHDDPHDAARRTLEAGFGVTVDRMDACQPAPSPPG